MKPSPSLNNNCLIAVNRSMGTILLGGLILNAASAVAQTNNVVVSAPVAPEDNSSLPAAPEVKPPLAIFNPEMHPPLPMPKTANPPILEIDPLVGQDLPLISLPTQTMPATIRNFEGQPNVYGYLPPDTNGEVGKAHYIQMINTAMAIYRKSDGVKLFGPFLPSTLWPTSSACGLNNDGDPIVLYDQLANRWLVSQFALPNFPSSPYYQCIAISKTSTPTNKPGDWWAYTFKVPNNKMNDYPKLAVWPNAYFMSVNQFVNASSWGGAGVYAFERSKMLNGQTARMVYHDVGAKNLNYGGMLPSDLDGSTAPPAGSPNYFVEVDDSSWISPADALRIWKFKVNWTNPANSTFGLNGEPNFTVNTAAFNLLPCVNIGSRTCIPQPSTAQKLDSLGDRLMFRLAYRNFGTHESLTVNHTVLAPNSTDRAAIRWYEIRSPGSAPKIYQQGTYGPGSSLYRWMGSMAMDKQGNIALGYSVSSSSVYPGIRIAGRLKTDPLGTLPQAERVIKAGTGSQTSSYARWGDYSDMTVDPVDDCTFWYTQEYIQTTSDRSWKTRIASFKYPGCS